MRAFFQNRLLVELVFCIGTFLLPSIVRLEAPQLLVINGFYLIVFGSSILITERGSKSERFPWRFPMFGLGLNILASGSLIDYENWLVYDSLFIWAFGLITLLFALTYASLRIRGYAFELNQANILGLVFFLIPYGAFNTGLVDMSFLESKATAELRVHKAYPDVKRFRRHHAILEQGNGKLIHILLPHGKNSNEIGEGTLLKVTYFKGVLGGLRLNAQ